MIEIERTFLAKEIPPLAGCLSKEIIDIYLPKHFPYGHAPIRIRKNGEKFEITKKTRIDVNDGSKLKEETIILTKQEFECLADEIEGKRVHKIRYYYPYKGLRAEVDVFQGSLKGLVIIEFEVASEELLKDFQLPPFCLADVTNEGFTRGGVLCGKSYADLEPELNRFGYKKLFLP